MTEHDSPGKGAISYASVSIDYYCLGVGFAYLTTRLLSTTKSQKLQPASGRHAVGSWGEFTEMNSNPSEGATTMCGSIRTLVCRALPVLYLVFATSHSAYAGNTAAPPIELGDLVWADLNGNGIQDDGIGVPGVEVNICGAASVDSCIDGAYADSAITLFDGSYLFTSIGSEFGYRVAINLATLPPGASATTPTSLFFDNSSGQLSGLSIDTADFGFEFSETVVPVPAAVWLFGSGLLGLLGVARRKAVVK